ncbi:MAG TPA: FAD:protein FMN transferase [Acidimicrobiales bacterium]|jgi:thiamine biosynthesis lipoprotein
MSCGELRFRAMGSEAHVIVVGGRPEAGDRIWRRIADLEARWSRFLDTSEISALNRRSGTPVQVSADTLLLVRRAIEATRISGGAFDPLVLGAMLRAGYDRSFDRLVGAGDTRAWPDPGLRPSAVDHPGTAIGGGHIRIDEDVVTLPPGAGFDPGGIGKGLAADLVVDEALADGVAGVCVNLGGDVRVAGRSPEGDGWTVAVRHPHRTEPIALVGLADGAVATSTTLLRTWHADGERRHHIIDPATGAPSDTDLTLATVVTARGWTSEVLAKSVLLRGSAHPFDLIAGTPADALAVGPGGRVQTTSGFAAYLGDAPVPLTLDETPVDRLSDRALTSQEQP